jgi:hypothetical protein
VEEVEIDFHGTGLRRWRNDWAWRDCNVMGGKIQPGGGVVGY